ncbi:AraC family transcriptional regulator, partial [Pseudomonas syringae pv. actinidiae ICMP 18807]
MDADDTSFLFGQRLFPGHYGAASHALRHAQNLHQALEILLRQQALLSPLLTPRLELDEHFAYLYWLDSCGAGEQQRRAALRRTILGSSGRKHSVWPPAGHDAPAQALPHSGMAGGVADCGTGRPAG